MVVEQRPPPAALTSAAPPSTAPAAQQHPATVAPVQLPDRTPPGMRTWATPPAWPTPEGATVAAPTPFEARPAVAWAEAWSPRVVAIMAFLFGFPAGIVLAALNWQRLGEPAKARWHLIGMLVFGFLAMQASFAMGEGGSNVLLTAISIGVSLYLYSAMKGAVEHAEADGVEVVTAGWGSALGIAVATLVVVSIVVFFHALIFAAAT